MTDDKDPELGGAADVFGVETTAGRAKREGDERDEESYQEEVEHRRSMDAARKAPLTAAPAAPPPGPTANEFKRGLAEDFLGEPKSPPPAPDNSGCFASLLNPKLLLIAAAVVIAAIIFGYITITDPGGDEVEDPDEALEEACRPHETLGDGSIQLIAVTQECPADEEEPPDEGATFVAPAPADLPRDAVLHEGTSAGEIGCITCDGQSRFVHIENDSITAGDPNRASQEIVWPEDGEVIEFGANVSGPNKGRYGFNLFAHGTEYRNGCSMEIGQTSCMQQTVSQFKAGDRVTIIIGEGGTLDDEGVPASVGDFVVSWWFVFQPG